MKTKIAANTSPVEALQAAIAERDLQIEEATTVVETLKAAHAKGSSFARGWGWEFNGPDDLPGALSLARAALDALQGTQRYARRELEDLKAIRDSESDLREVQSDLALLRSDLARVNASAAEMRSRAAGFAAELGKAEDALGLAYDRESLAALEGDAVTLAQAGEAVTQFQQVVDRHKRTGALAAARLAEVAGTQRAVEQAIDSLAHRLAAAKLACAKRELADLLPGLVALCADAYEAGYITHGGHLGGEAQVPDLLALVTASRGGSPVETRRRDPSPRARVTAGVGKLSPGVINTARGGLPAAIGRRRTA